MTDWLKLAQDAYSASTSYVDSNYRKKWEDALNMFQSKHPADSKYNTDAYKHRSKLFRPKTRSVVRRHEAAAQAAFFSNIDVVSIDAVDQRSKEQQASAELMREILNYRLTKTIPWFQVVVGGIQDALTVGVVCSYQYWMYRDKVIKELQPLQDEFGPLIDEITGQPIMTEVERREVVEDKPCVELLPVENIRIDAGASWIDPINSSPYVIRMIPMYVSDVKQMMEEEDAKTGRPKWKKLDDGEIRSAMKSSYDSTRQVREGSREDSKDQTSALGDFEIVWVHENFIRLNGEEKVYYTLGTEFMLTEPADLKDVYFHGERPIVMGACVIETHKIYPDSISMLGENLQREANEIQNQRLDNVKLVLNKRYIVKRGSQVDLKSLVRNVPGSITLANDPTGDVNPIDFPDVTGSSYQEQDRVNVDYDELTGNFSTGSVQSNRSLNETVGGMNLLSAGANQMVEYTIRTFTETWMEGVLRQLIKLEQAYETDTVVLAIAADRANLWKKYGIDQVTDDLMDQDLMLTVNVGMGATNPAAKIGSFIGVMKAYAEVTALQPPGMDMKEIGKEIFALAGYKDGRRFMAEQEDDAKMKAVVQQAQQFVQQAMQEVQRQKEQIQGKAIDVAKKEAQLQNKFIENKSALEKLLLQLESTKKMLSLEEQLVIERIEGAVAQEQIKQTEDVAVANDMIRQVSEQVAQIPTVPDTSIQESILGVLGEFNERIEQIARMQSSPRRITPIYDEEGEIVDLRSEVEQRSSTLTSPS